MGITSDPNDPGLSRTDERGMQETYLVLSSEDRAKGFVRPVRRSYVHVGTHGPVYPTRDLTDEEQQRYASCAYVAFEKYLRVVPAGAGYPPYEGHGSVTGRFWTAQQLEDVGKGCGAVTTMGLAIAETYARNPSFYHGTYCTRCQAHFPVGADGEFVWEGTSIRVGT